MRRWFIAGALVVVIAATSWYGLRTDPALAKARALQAQLASLSEHASRDDRRALMEQLRTQMNQLTDEQRGALFEDLRAPFQAQLRAAVDGYFAVPAAQRRAYLDQQIRQLEQRRKELEQRFAQRRTGGADLGPGGFPGRGGFTGGPPNGERPGGDRPAGGTSGAGGRGGGRERAMLDRSTPLERARSTEYFSALEKRRRELGLPEAPFGRR